MKTGGNVRLRHKTRNGGMRQVLQDLFHERDIEDWLRGLDEIDRDLIGEDPEMPDDNSWHSHLF